MTTIPIEPFQCGSRGVATLFEIRVQSGGIGKGASFDTHLWPENQSKELDAQVVQVTAEEFDSWLDDGTFYRLIATKGGYTPVQPSNSEKEASLELVKGEIQRQIDEVKS